MDDDIDQIIKKYTDETLPIKNQVSDFAILRLPSTVDSCRGVQMYSFYFDEALSPFLRNKLTVNDEIVKETLDAINKVISHIDQDLHYWPKERYDNIIYFDKYIKQQGDCLINDTYVKQFEIDTWRYTNAPDNHNNYNIRSNYIYLPTPESNAGSILPPFDILTIAKNWNMYSYFSDNATVDGQPFDIIHWTELIIGRFLTNMYIALCNGFIPSPQQIVVFSGMSRNSYQNNYREFGDITITNKIISTSMDENTSCSFLTKKNGQNPVLLRIFLPTDTSILPVTNECRAKNIGNEYEIILNYAYSLKIIRKKQEMRIAYGDESVDYGATFSQLLEYINTIGHELTLTPQEISYLQSNPDMFTFTGDDPILHKINHYISKGRELINLMEPSSYQVRIVDIIDMTIAKDEEILNLVVPIIKPQLKESFQKLNDKYTELNIQRKKYNRLQIHINDVDNYIDQLNFANSGELDQTQKDHFQQTLQQLNTQKLLLTQKINTIDIDQINSQIDTIKGLKKNIKGKQIDKHIHKIL